MPKRKEYDVYSGNQKIGEVWGEYDVFTPAERAEKRAKMMAERILDDLEKDRIRNTDSYRKKEAKADRNYKIRKVIGIFAIVVALFMAVLNIINLQNAINMFISFIMPTILFGLGISFIYSQPYEVNKKKGKPDCDWAGSLYMGFWCGVGFLIVDFLVSAFIVKFIS